MAARTRIFGFLFAFLASTSHAWSADKVLEKLQGEWTVQSFSFWGFKVDEELIKQTNVSISGNQLTINKFWTLGWTKVDPQTREADGYFNGRYGRQFSLVLPEHPDGNKIDLIVSGLSSTDEDFELDATEKGLIQSRTVRNKGIYSLDGDILKICFGEWISGEGSVRPAKFAAPEGSRNYLLVLKRRGDTVDE